MIYQTDKRQNKRTFNTCVYNSLKYFFQEYILQNQSYLFHKLKKCGTIIRYYITYTKLSSFGSLFANITCSQTNVKQFTKKIQEHENQHFSHLFGWLHIIFIFGDTPLISILMHIPYMDKNVNCRLDVLL